MEAKNSELYLATVKNVTKRLEFYGDVRLANVSLLKLILTYACYSQKQSTLQRLNSMLMHLQRTDKLIPMEIRAEVSFVEGDDEEITEVDVTSKVPNLNQTSVIAGEVLVHTFTAAQIYAGFSDPDGYSPGDFELMSLPSDGNSYLQYNGQSVSIGVIYTDPTLLTLTTRSGFTSLITSTFSRRVYNNNLDLKLYSNTQDIVTTFTEIIPENLPPTVGNLVPLNVDNRAETTITLEMLNAKYSDPENDPIDSIRIDSIDSNNQGVFKLLGVDVTVNQIISAADIGSGFFVHDSADVNSITTDSIEISVRDTINGEWVSSD